MIFRRAWLSNPGRVGVLVLLGAAVAAACGQDGAPRDVASLSDGGGLPSGGEGPAGGEDKPSPGGAGAGFGAPVGGMGGVPEGPIPVTCVPKEPPDDCEYPTSRGGGEENNECGFTPGAWYPIGNTQRVTWPALDPGPQEDEVALERVQEIWTGSEWIERPDIEFPDDGASWRLSAFSEWFGPLAHVHKSSGDDETGGSLRWYSEGQWNSALGHRQDFEGNGIEVMGVFMLPQDLIVNMREFWSEDCCDFESFRWNGSGFERISIRGEVMDAVSNSQRMIFARTREHASLPEEYSLHHQDGSSEDLDRLEAPPDAAQLRMFLDDSGVPFVAWPQEETLEIRMWNGKAWEALVPTDALLATLPPEFSWHVLKQDGQVLLRQFRDCLWRGLSASDKGGGVSNLKSEDGVFSSFYPESSLRLHPGKVCVEWFQEGPGFDPIYLYRCHDL